MARSIKTRWTLFGALIGMGTTLALVIGLGVLAGAGAASSSAKPVNTTPPSISGTAQEGQILSADNGHWDNNPSDYSYFWRRCDKNGGSCSSIGGAHSLKYTLTSADVGNTLRFRVDAKNADGTTTATSVPTAVVTAAGSSSPQNTSPPTIKGTPQEGQTLVGDRGTWSNNPSDYNDFWVRCGKNGGSCSNISGANNKNGYVLKAVDIGNTIRFKVQAKNAAGSNSASSAPTAVITAATKPPVTPATGCPPSGSNQVSQMSLPAKLIIDQFQSNPSTLNAGTQSFTLRVHVTSTCGGPVSGALVYGTPTPFNQFGETQTNTASDGWATLSFSHQANYPVNSKQQILAMFLRASKPGENVLVGITGYRLVNVNVNLHG